MWALANLSSINEAKPRLEPAPSLTLTLAPTLIPLALALTRTLALLYAPPYPNPNPNPNPNPKQPKQRLHELGTVTRLVEWLNQAAQASVDEGALMQVTPRPEPRKPNRNS